MLVTKERLVEVTLQDGSQISTFDDYIGNFIKNSKDYYEKNILDFFKDYIPTSAVIYDLGANIGNHTLYFSKQTNAKNVFAFEPSKEIFEVLEGNIKRNQLTNVQLFNLGVGKDNRKASLVQNSENMGASYLTLNDEGDIEVISLDTLNLPAPDFVKMDVEGFEYQALQGASELLKKAKPVIWIEIFQENYQEVDSLLTSLGYLQIDRWYENYIYVNPSNQNELLDYVNRFKERPLIRFTEQARETNRKYKNVTTKVNELTKRIEQAELKYRQATTQNAELKEKLSAANDQVVKNDATKELENQLKIEQLQNEHLKYIAKLEAQIITLETERQNVIAFLGGEGDLIPNILRLQEEINKVQDEKKAIREEIINLAKDLEKTHEQQKAHFERQNNELSNKLNEQEKLLFTKYQEISELERKLAQTQRYADSMSARYEDTFNELQEKNTHLKNHKDILTKRIEEQLNQLKGTIQSLNDKTKQVDDLTVRQIVMEEQKNDLAAKHDELAAKNAELVVKIEELIANKVNLEHELRNEMLDKINLLSKEEDFILKVEQEVVKSKKLAHEKGELSRQHQHLKQKYDLLTKKYNALSNSKLGKLTIKYWKFAKKRAKKGK